MLIQRSADGETKGCHAGQFPQILPLFVRINVYGTDDSQAWVLAKVAGGAQSNRSQPDLNNSDDRSLMLVHFARVVPFLASNYKRWEVLATSGAFWVTGGASSAVAALRPLIVSNELFSNDGLEVVAIFFFASFFFSGLWKKAGARSDRGLDCLCAARAPWRYEFEAPAHETLGGRLSNARVHRQQTHTPDAVLRGLHYKGCARSGQAGAAQKGVASC